MLFSFFDFPVKYQKLFQDPATPLMEGIIDLHHHIFFFLVVIIFVVVWLLVYVFLINGLALFYLNTFPTKLNIVLYKMQAHLLKTQKFLHNHTIEIVWTVVPSLILILIAIPSFALLYSLDEVINPFLTIKVIGHQWYWSYELNFIDYDDDSLLSTTFDSYMQPVNDLDIDNLNLRLLEVDAPLYLPIRKHIRILVNSADVLHAWAVPSLGVKIDAVPGRLNQLSIFIKREGMFYGQCSEICGINHGFMPILVCAYSEDVLYSNDLLNYLNMDLTSLENISFKGGNSSLNEA